MRRSVQSKGMAEDKSLESFRSSLDANYEWPCIFPFKFIVPKDQTEAVLELFADDPVQSRASRNGRFTAYTHGNADAFL